MYVRNHYSDPVIQGRLRADNPGLASMQLYEGDVTWWSTRFSLLKKKSVAVRSKDLITPVDLDRKNTFGRLNVRHSFQIALD